jgi:hypothetical protein
MIEQLNEAQQWGWAYELQEHNRGIAESNSRLIESNSILPDSATPQPDQPLLTMAEFITFRMEQIGNTGYETMMRLKEQMAVEAFRAMPPEAKAQIVAQLGIPDLIE